MSFFTIDIISEEEMERRNNKNKRRLKIFQTKPSKEKRDAAARRAHSDLLFPIAQKKVAHYFFY
jgi:hypothetical protein